MIEYIQFDFTRIDFDRNLRIGIELEVFAQQLHQTADLRFVQIRRRTTAPVQLADVTPGEQRCTMDDFLLQRVQILIGLVLLASNNLIATAEVTKLMAERNMYVER